MNPLDDLARTDIDPSLLTQVQLRGALVLAKLLISEKQDGEAYAVLRPYVIESGSETSIDLEEARALMPEFQRTNLLKNTEELREASRPSGLVM
jgi:hypothetical protein